MGDSEHHLTSQLLLTRHRKMKCVAAEDGASVQKGQFKSFLSTKQRRAAVLGSHRNSRKPPMSNCKNLHQITHVIHTDSQTDSYYNCEVERQEDKKNQLDPYLIEY